MEYTWIDYLKDSSWVTIAWEWLQSLLRRAVDFGLLVTISVQFQPVQKLTVQLS